MKDNKGVVVGIDGQDGEEIDVITGLPQGSKVSPIPFNIVQ